MASSIQAITIFTVIVASSVAAKDQVYQPPASAAASSSGQAKCGIANNNRIVGGIEASRCEYPWMVLVYNQATSVICGGSIIDARHILSAGHCFVFPRDRVIQPNELIIFSGSSNMSIEFSSGYPEGSFKKNYVEQINVHPDYSKKDYKSPTNDIAILRLRDDLPLDDDCHTPVCLVDDNEPSPQDARGCRTMGWGRTDARAASSDLMWTSVSILDNPSCQKMYARFGATTSSTFCAGGGGKDSCNGDSGGPLVCRGTGGAFYQHGVVSFGPTGCGTEAGLYTRVSSYLDWIQQVTSY